MEALRELATIIRRRVPEGGSWRSDALGLGLVSVGHRQEPTQQVYQPVFALIVCGEKPP